MASLKTVFNTKKGWTFCALLLALGLGIAIGSIVSDGVSAEQEKPEQLKVQGAGEPLALPEEVSLREGFARVAETIEPAVVNISAEAMVESQGGRDPHQSEAFRQFFGDDFWERFFGGPDAPSRQRRSSLGSGVIVDSKGYIISNYHVVSPGVRRDGSSGLADRIEVQLKSGDTYSAEIVGVDENSDLAVLKIRTNSPLPFAKVGDSNDLEVGDWVLAVGSPFGLEQTVTAGIVSATKRVVPETTSFGDYIQTDAAINPGNSGGPLVNMKGEVVGINTFISTNTGSYVGIGFAIPSNVFVNSYNQLMDGGKIERGWLGISMNGFSMTPELAEHFGVAGDDPKGIKDGDGVIVTQLIDGKGEVGETGPAALAGIAPGDVVVEIDGREIEDNWDLRVSIANTPPGKTVPVTIVRNGEVKHLEVVLAERVFEERQRAEGKEFSFEEEEEAEPPKEIGLEFQTLTERDAKQLGLENEEGVLIIGVAPGSLAEEAGLAPRLIVTHVNGKKVTSAPDFKDVVTSVPSGKGVVLRIISPNPQGQVSIGFTSFVKP